MISAIITAYQQHNGEFVVSTHKGDMSLADLLAEIIAYRGSWQSLGICYNHDVRINTVVAYIHVIVPDIDIFREIFIQNKNENTR